MSVKLILVAGARPNFVKIAPVWFEINNSYLKWKTIILHTGQHYDYEMSRAFFEDLDLPKPDYFLGVGSGTHAEQTAKTMIEFEKVLRQEKPALVVVFGDVNSTLACSVTAKKLMIPVAHVEAGLRSFDISMPEEINRKLTDSISDILLTPSKDANDNLVREGVGLDKIHFVGNIMIDSLMKILEKVDTFDEEKILKRFGLQAGNYTLVTLHRPSNVDNKDKLWRILELLNNLSKRIPVIFPVHPRTRKKLDEFGSDLSFDGELRITEAFRYKEFIILEKKAKCVITDSGGIQEETTYLDIPCLTLRPNTERPVTITEGTNELVALEEIEEKMRLILSRNWKQGKIPALWDGKTAKRIVDVFEKIDFQNNDFTRF